MKNSVKPYYHYLYKSLRIIDDDLHKVNEEEMVIVMIEDIVRLDALISLLIYADNTLPFLRCQKAFAKLKSELDSLNYLYREQNLLSHRHHATLGRQIGQAIDLDLTMAANRFKSKCNDLYLNTVHVTEQAIEIHINHINDEQFIVGILAYFTDSLELLADFDFENNINEIGYLIRSLLANLHFVAYVSFSKDKLRSTEFFVTLIDAVSILKTMHVYQRTLKSMGENNNFVKDLAEEISFEYDSNMTKLRAYYLSILNARNSILEYVKESTIKQSKASDKSIRESIQARNLLHRYT